MPSVHGERLKTTLAPLADYAFCAGLGLALSWAWPMRIREGGEREKREGEGRRRPAGPKSWLRPIRE